MATFKHISSKNADYGAAEAYLTFEHDEFTMVDREAKRAEGKGVGYDRWAAKHNLKQMAATVTAYQQYGFSSPEELDRKSTRLNSSH